MNYFATAIALKAASANSLTRSLYRVLTRLSGAPRPGDVRQALWLVDGLPEQQCRLLDLGTGWAHAYSLYPALLRGDDLHCFDAVDNRKFGAFIRSVPLALDQIRQQPLAPHILARAAQRTSALAKARTFDEAYKIAGITYQCSPSGIPDYPDNYFDRIFSIDVLEHVDAAIFPVAAATWYRILKPGGRFMAQVGIDDHLAFYGADGFGSKRYLRYSHRTWDWLLGNYVQYINRLTASQPDRRIAQGYGLHNRRCSDPCVRHVTSRRAPRLSRSERRRHPSGETLRAGAQAALSGQSMYEPLLV
jgi:SAM-dependent methyltransferase